MRQRKIKNIEERLNDFSALTINNPQHLKGKWKTVFNNDHPIYLEIGCGKGPSIMALTLSGFSAPPASRCSPVTPRRAPVRLPNSWRVTSS